uniref:Secretory carrier-associated membrane protein n=2 Tax=Bos TaxID=9903 RepID=A0A4W2HGE6_BOBOX
MSSFDTNPFADPVDVNPFQTNAATTVPVSQMPGASQPAVLQPSVEPTQPTPQAVASAAQASLLRQQEELDRKAAELERKERELQNTVANLHVRENNWPPLPVWCPVKPCFYQDFSTEIPADYQRICKMLYYLWMLHSVTLFLNLLACLAWFLVDTSRGVDFGLSILWFVIFTPCAFLCWYRPIYKAFRSDNSFSFFVFFFVFFCQIGIYIIQLIGIPSLGDSGWIAALSTMKHNLAVSVIMMVVAGFFTLCAVLSLFLLKRVSEWWVLGQLQTQGSPSPWGRHLSPAFSMGDVHHYSSCVSWVLRAPAASSKALGGRSDRLGSVVAALGP